MAWIFLGSRSLLSLNIIKPTHIPKETIKAHLYVLKLIPYTLQVWKHL
jgi:hypothetical protein